jgi:sugar phosphate permease
MQDMERTLQEALRYRWLILLVLSLQYLFGYFHRVAPAVVAQDLINTFSISATSLGVLASGYFYPYAIMQIPVGLLADSWGSRKTITFFGLLAAFGAIAFGLSVNFGMATVFRVIVGLGLSGIFVPAMKALSVWFRPGEYARISGILMAAGGLGWLSAAAPLAYVSNIFGWRAGFIGSGVITTILSILTWFLIFDKPEKRGYPPVVESISSEVTATRIGLGAGIRMVYTNPRFWPLAIWCFCNGSIIFSFCGLWAGPYLSDMYGLPRTAIGNILSMVAVGLVLGSPFLGYLSDKVFKSRKKVLFGCSLVTAIEWALFYVYFRDLSLPVLYLFFLMIGICIGASVILAFTATKELFPLEIAGTSISCVNLFGFVGGVIYQPLIGYFMDLSGKVDGKYLPQGYKSAFALLFATSMVFFLSTCFVKEKSRE